MNAQPSQRSHVDPFRVMQILGQTDEKSLVLCVGQPSSGAPTPVIRRVQQALIDAPLGYTPTLGHLWRDYSPRERGDHHRLLRRFRGAVLGGA